MNKNKQMKENRKLTKLLKEKEKSTEERKKERKKERKIKETSFLILKKKEKRK